ncbi:MAG: hypothetical protein U0Z53_03540 [Blastocatellia bacterium]
MHTRGNSEILLTPFPLFTFSPLLLFFLPFVFFVFFVVKVERKHESLARQ